MNQTIYEEMPPRRSGEWTEICSECEQEPPEIVYYGDSTMPASFTTSCCAAPPLAVKKA